MSSPNILILDIETSPILAYVWRLWDQNIALNQIDTDWHVLSWSAKWLHQKKTLYQDQRNARNIEDDSKILKALWKLLDEADIVIAQNGKAFDQKKLNARFITHGMQPPSSYKLVDTLLIARKHFGFTSNKLEYLAKALGTPHKKMMQRKFSGFELWRACLQGNIAAWREMEKYNRMDVTVLEEVYKKLIPWDNAINFDVYTDGEYHVCSCGSTDFRKRGFFYTSTAKYQRYKCTKCGAETRDRKCKTSTTRTRVAR